MMSQIKSKLLALLLIAALLTAFMPGMALAESKAAEKVPPDSFSCSANFGYDFKLVFSSADANANDWLEAVTGITVADDTYEKVGSSYSVYNNKCYYINTSSWEGATIYIGEGGNFTEGKAICRISAEGYKPLTVELDKTTHKATVIKAEPEAPELLPAPGMRVDTVSDYTYIQLIADKADYVSGVIEVLVNGTAWRETTSKIALNETAYYLDREENRIVFSNLPTSLKSGDLITFINPAYETLILKVSIAAGVVSVTPATGGSDKEDLYELHVRLVGSFEPAIVSQEGYDAISSASTNISQNKNSDVEVQAALLPCGQEPEEADWKLLSESGIRIDTDKTKTYVSLDNASGMSGIYSTYDSSLTLAGIPNQSGTYQVLITVTDDQGRTATSNSLSFVVYSGEEYLAEQLVLENCTQTADGKYMYDMEPWAIKNFTKDGAQTVIVPADIKAWYGSHTSGTYGRLGYAISSGEETTQTLIVPAGCNLTLVNMDLQSSVRIVVEDGARLVLRDSVVQGIVEVRSGGSFSMNYNDYGDGEFLMGASINGQLILQDGATVENAVIYSNTNYIANGDEVRSNDAPVVVVNGDVQLKGQVIIRGDEAATGSAGQTGLQVNGTLHIAEDAALAVYGGGYLSLTTEGGSAIQMNGGEITGGGKLIAVGGYGNNSGGDAVCGAGKISVADAYLEGGAAFHGTAGKPMDGDVILPGNTNRNLVNGNDNYNYGDDDSYGYWFGSTVSDLPDLYGPQYTIEKNAPGESSSGENTGGSVPDTNPGGDTNINIGEEDPPLSDLPEDEKKPSSDENQPESAGSDDAQADTTGIGEADVPKADIPQTGDTTDLWMLIMSMLLAVAVLAMVCIKKKNRI
ncbi:LPXTG cell wall anchor domain-containing protein [Ihubacter sp. mB4P-1]|uniref:LPXTG cell wall anchor domain-containing protein n=1 Tax=Ihubacter sp. mB4P-1 TaxID=3242370 RepID=UPI00137ACE0E